MERKDEQKRATVSYSWRRALSKLLLCFSKNELIPGVMRYRLLKLGGVRIGGRCFIGADVTFDTLHPELISIGEGAVITAGTKILSHFYSPKNNTFYMGEVYIGKRVFIGMNTLIVSPVSIGDGAVVGAGSVVTKDIPIDEIWAGNPAKFIKKR